MEVRRLPNFLTGFDATCILVVTYFYHALQVASIVFVLAGTPPTAIELCCSAMHQVTLDFLLVTCQWKSFGVYYFSFFWSYSSLSWDACFACWETSNADLISLMNFHRIVVVLVHCLFHPQTRCPGCQLCFWMNTPCLF